jgi:quercetin dioxygenase-like cupin family protein
MNSWHRMILGVLFLASGLCFAAATARAQDPVKVAPNNFKVLLENDQVRVLDFRSKGGEKIPMHSHPAYFIYSISGGGKTTSTSPDGKTREQENKVGQATWHEAETHSSQTTGAVHLLLIELKK